MTHRLNDHDAGIGIVTAVIVAFIVFTLGAVWYSISMHEIDETTFDSHRTTALHVADGGIREAMYQLSATTLGNEPFWEGSGTDVSGKCEVVTVTSEVNGSPRQLGQYWVQVTDSTPSDLTDSRYFIEAWGWARDTQSRQQSMRKIEQEVEIATERGFVYALFAASGGLAAGNQKTIYGDIYSGADIVVGNHTEIWANDAGFAGEGDITTAGTLTIPNGSNLEIEGSAFVQEYLWDYSLGSVFGTDVTVVDGGAYFRKSNVVGSVSLGGALDPTSDLTAGSLATGLPTLADIDSQPLPGFDWSTIVLAHSGLSVDGGPTASGPVFEWSTWDNFEEWYEGNRDAMYGYHYVKDSGSYAWKLSLGGSTEWSEDFMLVFDGNLLLEGGSSLDPSATAPVLLTFIANETTSDFQFGKNLSSSDDLQYVVYSRGTVGASNLAKIYGVVYGESDNSANKLEVHFRPPKSDIGFTFPTNLRVMARPLVWREVPDDPIPCTLP